MLELGLVLVASLAMPEQESACEWSKGEQSAFCNLEIENPKSQIGIAGVAKWQTHRT
ncbi:MAG TPA: hypothetical protein VFA77_01595 [Candidatus Eisenbacteria bacterium]|nr:hypothetical protein [Candidatus Eisenbacteria bacterium]